MTKSTIKFIKDQLERLKFSGKGKLYYAENFEGLALYVGKKKKTYYAHWSRPIIDKITGKVKMEGMRKRLDGFHHLSNWCLDHSQHFWNIFSVHFLICCFGIDLYSPNFFSHK